MNDEENTLNSTIGRPKKTYSKLVKKLKDKDIEYFTSSSVQKDIKEEASINWRKMRVRTNVGLLGLFCLICLAVYIVYISAILLYNVIFFHFSWINFFYYSFLLIIGCGTFFAGFQFARRIVLVDYIFDTAFENEIYVRLQPALKEVAMVHVGLEELKTRIDRLNSNVNRMRYNPPVALDPIKSIESTFFILLRYIILVNLSIGILIYMLLYPSEYTPYILTFLFPLWWVAITSEFKLWRVDEVWAWVFLPILITPVSIILIDVLIRYGTLIGIIGVALILYAFSYRTWAKFYVEDISLAEKVNNIAERSAKKRKTIKKKKPKIEKIKSKEKEGDISPPPSVAHPVKSTAPAIKEVAPPAEKIPKVSKTQQIPQPTHAPKPEPKTK